MSLSLAADACTAVRTLAVAPGAPVAAETLVLAHVGDG